MIWRPAKIDGLVVRSFAGPFVLTFFIALFVLVMQFLWKYVDELVGKGLSPWILAELMFFASARLVPLALPLAMLLASIMTFGSFGEHLELIAVRGAGVSLLRFMRPLIITSVFISIFAFFFSNNLLPIANLKFSALLYDIRQQKPTLALKEGLFYNGFDGYSMRIGKKDEATDRIYDMLIYDHTGGSGNDHVIMAKEAAMVQDEAHLMLTLKLKNGSQYKEVIPTGVRDTSHAMYRTYFKSWEKRFDMSEFKLSRSDESWFRDLKSMLTLRQLSGQIDTLKLDGQKILSSFNDFLRPYGLDSQAQFKTTATAFNPSNEFSKQSKSTRLLVLNQAINKARNIHNYADITNKQMIFKQEQIKENTIEIYRKFTLSIACLVLFFIGAPLGSIIRKGGLGWPLFYAVLFFILYHVSSIMGEKMAETNILSTFSGMWLSTFLLLPIGVFLTLKASNDSPIFSLDFYLRKLRLAKFDKA